MTQQFHEGPDIEVSVQAIIGTKAREWRKAKIVGWQTWSTWVDYHVEFPDGSRAVFDADHIRAVDQPGDFVEGGFGYRE